MTKEEHTTIEVDSKIKGIVEHIEGVYGQKVDPFELANLIEKAHHEEELLKHTIVEVVNYTFLIDGEEYAFTKEEIEELKEQIAIFEELFCK